MKYFKEMVKLARENGVGNVLGKDQLFANEAFWSLVPENEVFVFSGKPPYDPDSPDVPFDTVDAPFPIFSIEMADGPIAYIPNHKFMDGDGNGLALTTVYCIMVSELTTIASKIWDGRDVKLPSSESIGKPEGTLEKSFFVYCLCGARYGDGRQKHHVMEIPVNPLKNRRFYDLVRSFLDRLSAERDGVEEVPDVVMLPSGKDGKKKKPHPLRRIFHVVPKSRHRSYQPGQGRHVDWTHRWWVRGHWVHFTDSQRIGKNRTGEYVERGRTWRSEHEKGPEGAELVKKTRVVDGVKE